MEKAGSTEAVLCNIYKQARLSGEITLEKGVLNGQIKRPAQKREEKAEEREKENSLTGLSGKLDITGLKRIRH